jgi:hypothetical protein
MTDSTPHELEYPDQAGNLVDAAHPGVTRLR